jgi:hypothetical protein
VAVADVLAEHSSGDCLGFAPSSLNHNCCIRIIQSL